MFFEKDTFTKNINQLTHSISHAETLMKNVNDDNTQGLNDVKKTLKQASKLLKLLYSEISTHKNREISTHMTIWDELTLKTRNGQYDHLVNRYKDIQQQLDDLHSQPKPYSY